MALVSLLFHDHYLTYLRPDFGVLLAMAAAMLTAMVFAVCRHQGSGITTRPPDVRVILIFIAPLAHLFMSLDVPLNASAFVTRWTGFHHETTSTTTTTPDQRDHPKTAPHHNVTHIQLIRNAAHYQDQDVSVMGILFRDPEITDQLGDHHFVLYRFVINCCVADAMPVAILVNGIVPDEWPDDTWVTVHGRVNTGVWDGSPYILIAAETMDRAERPKRPYLLAR
jgi:uncharacterized repeat protein (TIGR03943 family)